MEIRSKNVDSHSSHVFNDGPFLIYERYCVNLASLKFISKNQLKEKGYEKFLFLFSE